MRRTRSISAGTGAVSGVPTGPLIGRTARMASANVTPGARRATRSQPPVASPNRARPAPVKTAASASGSGSEMLGITAWPTMRNVREWSGPVIRTRPPSPRPASVRVSAPSATSSGPDGARPATIPGSIRPCSCTKPQPSTGRPATSTLLLQIEVTAASSRTWTRRVVTGPQSFPGVVALASRSPTGVSHVHPYAEGVDTRWSRLAENTSTATTTRIPNAEPISDDRTGNAWSARPRSRAKRVPAAIVGGAPNSETVRTVTLGRAGSRRGRVARAVRVPARTASTSTTTSTATRPPRTASASTRMPGSGSAWPATPIGNNGDASTAPTTASNAPTTAIGTPTAAAAATRSRGRAPSALSVA